MGGKGSGRPRMTLKRTLIKICSLLGDIQEELEATNATMSVLEQRLQYYTKTVSKRC
jgi:hypothetical protein